MNINTDYETLKVSLSDSILTIIVNRPDKLNALNEQVLTELKNVLVDVHQQDKSFAIKGMILTGEGDKAFIAGADIAAMRDMSPEEGRKFGKLGQQVTILFENLRVPVIAVVNGFALGGGCEMAMSCDLIYATANAQFGQPEVNIGLIPGFGGTQRLAKYIGHQKAKELIYTGKIITADVAKEWGLVREIFETKEQAINSVKEFINVVASKSPNAIYFSKKAINAGCDLPTENGLAIELKYFHDIFDTKDRTEGLKAFIEKRKPHYRGE